MGEEGKLRGIQRERAPAQKNYGTGLSFTSGFSPEVFMAAADVAVLTEPGRVKAASPKKDFDVFPLQSGLVRYKEQQEERSCITNEWAMSDETN